MNFKATIEETLRGVGGDAPHVDASRAVELLRQEVLRDLAITNVFKYRR